MVVLSPLQTIASRFSAKAPIRTSRLSLVVAVLVSLIASLSFASSATAHQPVLLTASASNSEKSPILLDGTVSFAVYATMKKSKEVRYFRFNHKAGDRLDLQYLIPDDLIMKKMTTRNLPQVVLIDPNGKKEEIKPKERTYFFEPYGGKGYFYISRISTPATAGTYTVAITSKRASSVVIAVGIKEIPGDVLAFGSGSERCPVKISGEVEISPTRAGQLVGMSEEEAKLCASINGWSYRIGKRDGQDFAVTMDFRSDRVTVSILSGVITEINVG
ncbi:MAG: hypothetical protein RLZZ17_190 [Actinomycetota bacterium]